VAFSHPLFLPTIRTLPKQSIDAVNSYFDPGEQRAHKVNTLFDKIAPRYDFINDVQSFGWHRLWKRKAVGLADANEQTRALDLCCGTGDLAWALARQGAHVTGLDFSEAMLAIAQNRRIPCPHPPVFLRGDAQRLPFPDQSFEVVTISYGLRNLARWQLGLEEMVRVAKPGGRIIVLDFGKPDNPLWRSCYFAYLRWMVPVFGRLFCGDSQAYAYILESLRHFPAQRGIEKRLCQLPCHDVTTHHLLGGVMGLNFARKK
jgi:demethylmenaquinone methyltransferase/2-methoxy-6-polyprenyl-1,4-benzoquinol methylase